MYSNAIIPPNSHEYLRDNAGCGGQYARRCRGHQMLAACYSACSVKGLGSDLQTRAATWCGGGKKWFLIESCYSYCIFENISLPAIPHPLPTATGTLGRCFAPVSVRHRAEQKTY
jgi:hypothetical protein